MVSRVILAELPTIRTPSIEWSYPGDLDGEALERCLACEAVVNKASALTHVLLLSTLCIASS